MHVEQNSTNENEQALAVFDGLLPKVGHFFLFNDYVQPLQVFASINILLQYQHASVGFQINGKNFQEFGGEFKTNIISSYLPNDVGFYGEV